MTAAPSQAPTWNSIHATRSWGRWPTEDIVRTIYRHPVIPHAWALDLGCGAGAHVGVLAERGWPIIAVDCSLDALERTQKVLFDAHKSGFICHQRDLEREFDLLGMPLGLAIDSATTACLSEDAATRHIDFIRQHLVPGGLFVARAFPVVPRVSEDTPAPYVRGIPWWQPRLAKFREVTFHHALSAGGPAWLHIEARV